MQYRSITSALVGAVLVLSAGDAPVEQSNNSTPAAGIISAIVYEFLAEPTLSGTPTDAFDKLPTRTL
jgi:hypothetical protein